MKKLTFLAAIVIIALQIFAVNDAKAQCPFGWYNHSFTYTTAGGCKIDISFCVACETITTDVDTINVYGINAQNIAACDGVYTPMSEIAQAIHQEIWDQGICHFPPCDEGFKESILDYSSCGLWHKQRPDSPCIQWYCTLGETVDCRIHFHACVDYTHSPTVIRLIETRREQINTPSCPPANYRCNPSHIDECFQMWPCTE